jgi:hypothetical protein
MLSRWTAAAGYSCLTVALDIVHAVASVKEAITRYEDIASPQV